MTVPAIKVLVVDDEPLLQTLIEQNFETQILNNEMHFIFANNGVEALEKTQSRRYDRGNNYRYQYARNGWIDIAR